MTRNMSQHLRSVDAKSFKWPEWTQKELQMRAFGVKNEFEASARAGRIARQ